MHNIIKQQGDTPSRVLMVLTSVEVGGGVQTKIMDIYKRIDKTRIQFDFFVHVEPNQNSFYKEIISMGGRVYYFGKFKKIGLYKYLKHIYKLMKNSNYKAVHSYLGVNDGLILTIARLTQTKIRISHVRTIITESKKRRILNPLLKYLIKRNSTDLLAASKQAGKALYGYEEFQVIPNALDPNKFLKTEKGKVENLKREIGISNNMLVLGHIGRFSIEKNHEFLLEIAMSLKGKSVFFKMILVGEGELKRDIIDKIKSENLESYFYIVGAIPNPEIYYCVFDVILFPSFHEGFGNVALEAQVANKPVIASKGVSSETDLGLGLIEFIDIESIDEWVNKILKISSSNNITVSEKVIRETLKKRNFDVNQSVERYYKLYNV